MTKIKMKALQYQSVPQGNEKQYVDAEGEFFVFSEQEALARVERRLAERLSPESTGDQEEGVDGRTKDNDEDETSKPWALTLTPQEYLDKYGDDKKHSAHAKAVIDRGEGGK